MRWLPSPAQTHWLSIQLGVTALLIWLVIHHGLRRMVFIPQSLVILALAIVASYCFNLGNQGVALVGHVEWQALALHVPDITMDHWLRAAEVAPALLLILFAESWGSVRSLALQTGDTVDANREMLAFGAANLTSALLQGLPVGAGFSAASANFSAGGSSKWAGIAAAIALALFLWLARIAPGPGARSRSGWHPVSQPLATGDYQRASSQGGRLAGCVCRHRGSGIRRIVRHAAGSWLITATCNSTVRPTIGYRTRQAARHA